MFLHRRAVDLTLIIDEEYPTTWPGHQPFMRRTWNWFETVTFGPEKWTASCGPYFTEALILDEHIGTHFDAPAHMIRDHAPGQANPICGDDIPLSVFVGDAVCIDVTGIEGREPGVSPIIEADFILGHEERRGRRLAPGDAVLFRSDWDRRFYRAGPAGNAYAHDVLVARTAPGWPAPDVACIELLLDRGIRCVGTDAPSIGPAHDGPPAHRVGLGRGMVFVEGLSNLARVPDRGGVFQFLPLRISRSSGGPGRAVLWLED